MNRVSVSFTIASCVPFVALSLAVSMHAFHEAKPMVQVLLTYAAAIISFLGGIHWGVAIKHFGQSVKMANLLMLEGVVPSLVAWGALFYFDIHIQLLVLTLLYTFMWAVDSLLYNSDIIPQWFFNLRCIVTPIVVVSLYVAYFGLI